MKLHKAFVNCHTLFGLVGCTDALQYVDEHRPILPQLVISLRKGVVEEMKIL